MMRVHALRVRGRAVECDDLTLVQGTVEANERIVSMESRLSGVEEGLADVASAAMEER